MPTVYFATKREAKKTRDLIAKEASANGVEVYTEIEKSQRPEDKKKPYALYYEELESEDGGECPECAERVCAFMTIGVCDDLRSKTKPDCDGLAKKYESGEMTASEVVAAVYPHAEGEQRGVIEELLKEAHLPVPVPGPKNGRGRTLEAEGVEGDMLRVMAMSAFFGSWKEAVDPEKLRTLSGTGSADELFGDFENKKRSGVDILHMFIKSARTDTEEGLEKKEFFEDAVKVMTSLEKGEELSDIAGKLKLRRRQRAPEPQKKIVGYRCGCGVQPTKPLAICPKCGQMFVPVYE